MAAKSSAPIRVLVVDDEAEVRDAYRQILLETEVSKDLAAFRDLRARLFSKPEPQSVPMPAAETASAGRGAAFEASFCADANSAVVMVRDGLAAHRPFAVVFLDVRMPPGPDGVWAAARIREMDPTIEIAMCTAYSDTDPEEIGGLVPPEDKLSYLQKPFHPHEIRQMAISLGAKWRAEQRVIKLAYFDALTGLANRQQFQSGLASSISAAARHGTELAVLYLDLDNFKRINDTLGHAMGDELLRVVASRMRRTVRRGDMAAGDPSGDPSAGHIARLGGDEFIVVLPEVDGAGSAGVVASRLIGEIQAPVKLGIHSVVITPSIGIAMYPADGSDVESLLRNADLAMYSAKRANPGTYAYFDTAMNVDALQRFTLEAKLRGALERGEFSLCYQPQFEVGSGRLSGMEALLRWNNPELGSVPPVEFIPVAEETGLIFEIGAWVLRAACTQARVWAESGLPPTRMAVNVSGQQFALKEFPQLVASILRETGVDPALLELEITESVVMEDEDWAEEALAQLKELGVSLAIDDFGTGYSSLGRLRRFAVDRLKIDRSFVTGLVECNDDQAIAAAIIAMARSLRIHVTAEGVESLQQLMFLQEQDCNEAQGFLFSRALPAGEAEKLLRRAADASDSSRTTRLRTLMS